MKTTKVAFLACTFIMASVIMTPVWASIQGAFYVASDAPLLDATGYPLAGTWGQPDSTRCLVEIRAVGSGIVPPTLSREPDEEANPLFAEVRIGDNVFGANSGMFCATLATNRPVADETYFIRVYNAPSRQFATMYADSTPFQDAHSDAQITAFVSFPEGMQTFAFLDDTPAYEYNGITYTVADRELLKNMDRDGDGWSDWFEIVSGMDRNTAFTADELTIEGIFDFVQNELKVKNPAARGAFARSIEPIPNDELANTRWLTWRSFSGVTYRIEYADMLEQTDNFKAILTNTAQGDQATVNISDYFGATNPAGFFRIRAVPPQGGN